MKRLHLLLVVLGLLSNVQLWAFRTTITSAIHLDTTESVGTYQSTGNFSTHIKRVDINNLTNIPSYQTAMDAAAYIFSAAMSKIGIDLVEIKANVVMEDLNADSDIICKVDIVYSDTIEDISDFHQVSQYLNLYHPVLIPMAMSDQSRRENHGVGLTIRLQSGTPFHSDITPAPEDKYDLITILLRALAMGCGIQSTFDASTLNVGIDSGNVIYVNAFDTQIFNENLVPLMSVVDGNISLSSFLNGKNIYAEGWRSTLGTDTVHISLHNQWKYFPFTPLSDLTLNTLAPEQYRDDWGYGSDDILTADMQMGVSFREVTPYTITLLRKLGWMRTIPVGYNPYVDLYACHLLCSDSVLLPNVGYTISFDRNMVTDINSYCELQSINNTYTIGNFNGSTFSYSNIPNNIQWRRNPITKNIIGQIKAEALSLYDFSTTQMKICDIEIPYRPNKPIVHKSETSNSSDIYLDLSAFANGSDMYTISYTGLTYSDVHSFSVSSNAIDTILCIPATQYYDVAIYGTNSNGNSDTYYFTIGSSIQPQIDLKVTVSGNTLRYYLNSDNATYLPNTTIGTKVIVNTSGTIMMSPSESPGEAISISSLPQGYYLFSVIINGQAYSKPFFKRNRL